MSQVDRTRDWSRGLHSVAGATSCLAATCRVAMGLGGPEPPTSRLSGRWPDPPIRRTSLGYAVLWVPSAALRVCLRRVSPLVGTGVPLVV